MTRTISVVGGGIGGLCSALALAQRGFKVRVIEQAGAIREVGAGLQLSPNSVKVLNALKLSEALAPYVFSPQRAVMRDYQSGRAYFSLALGESGERRYGASYWHMHRADLQQVLLTACIEQGVTLRLSEKAACYQHSADGKAVTLLSEQQQVLAESDVLIGADGIHSAIQQTLLANQGLKSVPRFTGQVAWRGTVNVKDLPPGLIEPWANLWVGPGRHFVSYYVRGGQEINFVAVEERSDWRSESWYQTGDLEQLRAAFSGWHPHVTGLLATCQQCFLWALFDRPPLSSWTDGRVALLGDACHPMLPFLAQGAAMAIEDSYVLASMLSQHADCQTALSRYQQARLPRTARVQYSARQNAALYHRHGWLNSAKLAVLAALAPIGASNWLAANQLRWLYKENVVNR